MLKTTFGALKEVIVAASPKAHEPTATEYFALVSTVLASSASSSSSSSSYTLDLLRILIGVVDGTSKTVLRAQFKPLSKTILTTVIAQHQASSDKNDIQLLQLALRAQGLLMRHQESSDGFWNSIECFQCINSFLSFIDDSRTSIRKETHAQLNALMLTHRDSKANGTSSSVRSYIADFCSGVLDSCTRSNYNRALCVVLFLEHSALTCVPEQNVVQLIANTIQKLPACEVPRLTSAAYRMLDAFFQSSNYMFKLDTTAAIINNLLLSKPVTSDMETNAFYWYAFYHNSSIQGPALLITHIRQ